MSTTEPEVDGEQFEELCDEIEDLADRMIDEPGATRYLKEAKEKVLMAKRMYDWEIQG